MIEFAARDVAPEWAALAAQATMDAEKNLAFPGAADISHDPLSGLLTRTLLNNIGSPYDPRGLGRNHTKDYEIEVVNLLGDVFSAPPTRWGYVTSGSTEAIRHALLDGRRRYPHGVVYCSAAGHPVDRTKSANVRVVKVAGPARAISSTQRPEVRSCVMVGREGRDVGSLALPRWGRVVPAEGVVPFVVVGADGLTVAPIEEFLRDFVARGCSAGSVRSYAYALARWWRFLLAVDVVWDKASAAEVRDFVLWLRQAAKSGGARRPRSKMAPGAVNPITRKQYLDDFYKIATVRHSNAVLRTFYDYWIGLGAGPLLNPVPVEAVRGRRAHAHHNPMQPFRAQGRLRYNPRLARRRPRAMPDERWDDLFAAMRSDRDRAILALAVSTGARASELLGLRDADVDWGDQLIRVIRKGSGAQQWLAGSVEAFVWLRLYVEQVGPIGADDRVWVTLRRRRRAGGRPARQVLTYDALRAVLRRANDLLGTNWTMHDLRHTCALRMLRDPRLNLTDIQTILGHAHLSTTEVYLQADDHEVIGKVREHLLSAPAAPTPSAGAVGYAADDLAVLLGGEIR